MPAHTWLNRTKRFGVACFISPHPVDPDGDGDAYEEFDLLADAKEWCEKALSAGRFHYLAIWDGRDDEWKFIDSYSSEERHVKTKLLHNASAEEIDAMRTILQHLIGTPIGPGDGIVVEINGQRYDFDNQVGRFVVAAVVK